MTLETIGCDKCKFAIPVLESVSWECRFMPPTANVIVASRDESGSSTKIENRPSFPVVTAEDWCYQWKYAITPKELKDGRSLFSSLRLGLRLVCLDNCLFPIRLGIKHEREVGSKQILKGEVGTVKWIGIFASELTLEMDRGCSVPIQLEDLFNWRLQ